MNTEDFCVSRAYAQVLVNTLSQRQLPIPAGAAQLLQQDGSSGEAIPVSQWIQLLDDASREIPDSPIGLLVGQAIEPRHLGVLGYALMASENVGELVRRYVQYQCTIIRGFPTTLRESKGLATLSWPVLTPFSIFQSNVCGVTAILTALRKATGEPGLCPAGIGFVDEVPRNVEAYEEVLGDKLSFNNEVVSFSLPTTMLDTPLIGADADLISILHKQLEGLAPLSSPDGRQEQLILDLHRTIAGSLGLSRTAIEHVSEKMGMSKRTLSRRLEARNTSYRQELNRVQERVAKSYLRDGRIPLVEVALLVGYEDQSSFTRAFKKWTGLTPGRWQENADLSVFQAGT